MLNAKSNWQRSGVPLPAPIRSINGGGYAHVVEIPETFLGLAGKLAPEQRTGFAVLRPWVDGTCDLNNTSTARVVLPRLARAMVAIHRSVPWTGQRSDACVLYPDLAATAAVERVSLGTSYLQRALPFLTRLRDGVVGQDQRSGQLYGDWKPDHLVGGDDVQIIDWDRYFRALFAAELGTCARLVLPKDEGVPRGMREDEALEILARTYLERANEVDFCGCIMPGVVIYALLAVEMSKLFGGGPLVMNNGSCRLVWWNERCGCGVRRFVMGSSRRCRARVRFFVMRDNRRSRDAMSA